MLVIGAGRVGGAFASRAQEHGAPCTLVSRTEGWEALEGPPGDPVLVTTGADDLADVVARVPSHRRMDLVFVQNGMIRTWLSANALANVTRGLLFFAVPKRGAPLEPGGTSPFTGPHALAVARWLVQIQVPAEVVDWARFVAQAQEKLIWNVSFGLLCEAKGASVGDVVNHHRDELEALVTELARVGRVGTGADVPHDYLMDALCRYSLSIPDYTGRVKDWPWRNGWFVQTAKRFGVAIPVHRRLLDEAGWTLEGHRRESAEDPS